MASSMSGVRSWRTAFLTLRDETLTSPPPSALLSLLRDLILSHPTDELAAAATDLPPHEVTSDVTLLAELGLAVSECQDAAECLLQICHLIHDVYCRVHAGVCSSSWTIMLNFLGKTVEQTFGNAIVMSFCLGSTSRVKVLAEILEILRLIDKTNGKKSSLSESMHLVEFLLRAISCLHLELLTLYHSNDMCRPDANIGTRNPKCSNLWEMKTITFSIIGDTLSRIGPSISEKLWQSLVEVLRKEMDFLASKNLLVADNVMSRFSTALLHCLHLVLTDPKGSLSGQVASFVATLQMFFAYGVSSTSRLPQTTAELKEKGVSSPNQKPMLAESRKSLLGPYVPPHLRRRERTSTYLPDAQASSDCEPLQYGLSSSDSDHSDSDGYVMKGDMCRTSKARAAAIICIQDLCRAEPKSLASLWTLILPENDVLQPRKYQANLMTCLLFDPVIKIRIASTSTLIAMLDGHSLTFLQVAEHKGSTKCGSFTTLSNSLGQILMQLHTGILYLIQRETHSGLLASLFKVLVLLISATPYDRMPGNLLPTVIASVCTRMQKDLACKIEHASLLGTALSCLGTALARSPPSSYVLQMLEQDISRGIVQNQQEPAVLSHLIQFSDQGKHPAITFEAFQALKAVSHNYPSTVTSFWENISSIVHRILKLPSTSDASYDHSAGSWKGDAAGTAGFTTERCIMAAIKALDGCLRAASGFKGADDFLECRLADIQLIADCSRRKKVSSAPSYELNGLETSTGRTADFPSGAKQWCEAIEKHLPLAKSHISPMVRAASITCFAGMTSGAFFSLSKENQEFVISSAVAAALNDEAASVRSAACRAIGVITCFPQIVRSGSTVDKFIQAAEYNSHDSSAAVRITASWALANICDSLRHIASELLSAELKGYLSDSKSITQLIESALQLTKDGDKIKSNAVRALGNLSRFVKFSCFPTMSNGATESIDYYDFVRSMEFSESNVSKSGSLPKSTSVVPESTFCVDIHLLERMVQAFLSCVTTGNVKVQWNVCHALSNLFMNETLKLHDMSWAPAVYSILLLLLRDSTNYKIRIHAAVALAVPASRLDYGNSYSDVVQGVEHVLESLNSDQGSTFSSFKYKDNLEKQLALTTLHVLGFASPNDDQALKDFLIKKASFLEEWFKSLCSFSTDYSDQPSTSETTTIGSQNDGPISYLPKKEMVSRAVKTLLSVYECSNHQNIAQKFAKLAEFSPSVIAL